MTASCQVIIDGEQTLLLTFLVSENSSENILELIIVSHSLTPWHWKTLIFVRGCLWPFTFVLQNIPDYDKIIHSQLEDHFNIGLSMNIQIKTNSGF